MPGARSSSSELCKVHGGEWRRRHSPIAGIQRRWDTATTSSATQPTSPSAASRVAPSIVTPPQCTSPPGQRTSGGCRQPQWSWNRSHATKYGKLLSLTTYQLNCALSPLSIDQLKNHIKRKLCWKFTLFLSLRLFSGKFWGKKLMSRASMTSRTNISTNSRCSTKWIASPTKPIVPSAKVDPSCSWPKKSWPSCALSSWKIKYWRSYSWQSDRMCQLPICPGLSPKAPWFSPKGKRSSSKSLSNFTEKLRKRLFSSKWVSCIIPTVCGSLFPIHCYHLFIIMWWMLSAHFCLFCSFQWRNSIPATVPTVIN